MAEKEHGKTTAGTSAELGQRPSKSPEAFEAYLAAVLAPLGREDEMPAVAGNVDEFEGATVTEEANVLDDPFRAQPTDADLAVSEPGEERFVELVRLDCVEGEHEVFGNPFDLHGYSSFGDGGRNLITQILTWFMCGAAGATAMLAIEKLTGS